MTRFVYMLQTYIPVLFFLKGGLGNQLSQYAYSYEIESLFARRCVYIYLQSPSDTMRSELRIRHDRIFFSVPSPLFNFVKIILVFLKKIQPIASKIFCLIRDPSDLNQFIPENPQKIRSSPLFLLFDGYWQSNTVKDASLDAIASCILRLSSSKGFKCFETYYGSEPKFCAVHIRRGDLMSSKNISIHSPLSLGYFANAIKVIQSKLGINNFIVFTDYYDPQSLVSGLTLSSSTAVNVLSFKDDGLSEIDAFLALSAFSYIAISNSTYSLWASLLGPKFRKALNFEDLASCIVQPSEWTKTNSFYPHIGNCKSNKSVIYIPSLYHA